MAMLERMETNWGGAEWALLEKTLGRREKTMSGGKKEKTMWGERLGGMELRGGEGGSQEMATCERPKATRCPLALKIKAQSLAGLEAAPLWPSSRGHVLPELLFQWCSVLYSRCKHNCHAEQPGLQHKAVCQPCLLAGPR